MDELKRAIAKVAPFILCWIMGLITYFMAENTAKGFDALIAVLDILK